MKKKKIILSALLIAAAAAAAAVSRSGGLFPAAPPPPFRVFGPAKGAVTVTEFSDLACPACASAWAALEGVADKYPDLLRVEFRHYPLTAVHKWSLDAAVHADCAGRQGKFREYSSRLFAGQKEWAAAEDAPARFSAYAGETGLDVPAFDACRNSPEVRAGVEKDLALGESRRIESTPTFFIGGKRLVGPAQLMDRLRPLIIAAEPRRP